MKFCKNCSSRIDEKTPICPICGKNADSVETVVKTTMPRFKSESYPSGGTYDFRVIDESPHPVARSDSDSTYIHPKPEVSYKYAQTPPMRPVSRGVNSPDDSAEMEYPSMGVRNPSKAFDESERFVRSTCKVTNIILTVLIVITLAVGGCLVYLRFFSQPKQSASSDKVLSLVERYLDAVNENDPYELTKLTVIALLSDDQISESYKTTYDEMTYELSRALAQFEDHKLSADNIRVTDMTDAELKKLNKNAPSGVKFDKAVNIECTMYLTGIDKNEHRTRKLSAVFCGGEWYLYNL